MWNSALAELRGAVAADGADLVFRRMVDGAVELDLVLGDADCRECVMPRAHLERVALHELRAVLPGVEAVRVSDPREEG